jgi:hypothetical protein
VKPDHVLSGECARQQTRLVFVVKPTADVCGVLAGGTIASYNNTEREINADILRREITVSELTSVSQVT